MANNTIRNALLGKTSENSKAKNKEDLRAKLLGDLAKETAAGQPKESAVNTKTPASTNAAGASSGLTLAKAAEQEQKKNSVTPQVTFPKIPLSTASMANMVNAGLANRTVKPEAKTTTPIVNTPVSLSLDAMNTTNKAAAGTSFQNAQKPQETAVLPGVTRPYTQMEQVQERRREALRVERESLQNQMEQLGKERQLYVAKRNVGNTYKDELKRTGEQIETARNRIREVDEILNPTRETNIHPLAYQAARVGVGAVETAENWASSLAYTLGDALTDGKFSDNQKKVSDYLAQNPALAEQLYTHTPSAAQRIANAAGVSVNDVEMFRKTTGAEYLREGLNSADNITAGMQAAGNIAETIGQMLPSILLTAGYTPANPAKPADGVAKFIASKITPAPGDAFIGASVYGGQLEALAKERGFDVSNYLNAAANAAVETAIEKALGFSDAESFQRLFMPTGSTGKSVLKGIANYIVTGSGEGLEEVVNVPLSEIIDRMTGVSDRTNIIGAGGIFDVAEMAKSGLSGSAVGLIMGGVGGMAAVAGSVVESGNIRRGVAELSGLQKDLPEAYRVEIPDAKKVTLDEFNALSAKYLENLERFKDDLAAGKVTMPEETPAQDTTPTAKADVPTAEGNTPTETASEPVQENAEITTAQPEILNEKTDVEKTVVIPEQPVMKSAETSETQQESVQTPPEPAKTTSTDNRSIRNPMVSKAVEAARVDADSAAFDLVAEAGSVKKAIDALYEEGVRLGKMGTPEAKAIQSEITSLWDAVAAGNTRKLQIRANTIQRDFRHLGVQIRVNPNLEDGVWGRYVPGENGKDGVYEISPYLEPEKGLLGVTLHEIFHQGVTADKTLVEYADRIREAMVKSGEISAGRYDLAAYSRKYAGDVTKYAQSAKGQEVIHSYMQQGMSEGEAIKQFMTDFVHEEMDADFMRDVLLNNPELLTKLTKDERSLVRKILDKIKEFIDRLRGKAPSGTADRVAAQIRKVLNSLDKADVDVPEPRNSRAMDTETLYSQLDELHKIGRKSVNAFTSAEIQTMAPWAEQLYMELGEKSPFFRAWFGDWRAHDTTPIQPVTEKGDARGNVINKDTGWEVIVSKKISKETAHQSGSAQENAVKYLPFIKDITEKAVLLGSETSGKGNPLSVMYHTLYAYTETEGYPAVLRLKIEELVNEKTGYPIRRDYILQEINEEPLTGSKRVSNPPHPDKGSSINSIADLFAFVNENDETFDAKPASEIRNKDGTPKVMYHGTKEQFTVFDKKKAKSSGLYGKGFYFTGSESHSGQYGDSMAVYLDIKRPLSPDTDTVTEDQIRTFLEAVAENEDYSIENYGTYDVDEILDGITSRDMFGVLQDINATAIWNFVEAVELFNEVNGTEYDGIVVPTETVAFRANQIKSATDNAGTFDGDNPDIRASREIFSELETGMQRNEELETTLRKQYSTMPVDGWGKYMGTTRKQSFAADVARLLPGVTVEQVRGRMDPVWELLATASRGGLDTADVRYQEARDIVSSAAKAFVEDSVITQTNPLYFSNQELREFLRTTPVKMDVSKADFGGDEAYKTWRSQNRGLLRITDDPGARGVDAVYSELADRWPEFFPDTIVNPADMLQTMGDVAAELKATSSTPKERANPFEGQTELAAQSLTNRIMAGIFGEFETLRKTQQEDPKTAKKISDAVKQDTAAVAREIRKANAGTDAVTKKIASGTGALASQNRQLAETARQIRREISKPGKRGLIRTEALESIVKNLDTKPLKRFEYLPSDPLESILNSIRSANSQTIADGKIKLENPLLKRLEDEYTILREYREALDTDKLSDSERQAGELRYMQQANTFLRLLHSYTNTNTSVHFDGKDWSVSEFAEELKTDLASRRKYKDNKIPKSTFGGVFRREGIGYAEKLHMESVNPSLYFSMWGETGAMIDRTFREAQREQVKLEREFTEYMEKRMPEGYRTMDASGYGNTRIPVRVHGKDMTVSRAQLMSLRMIWKYDIGKEGAAAQGVVIPDAAGNQRSQNSFVVDDAVYEMLMEKLSPEDRKLADDIGRFLALKCAPQDTMMALYGDTGSSDPHLFPLEVSDIVDGKKKPEWGAVARGIQAQKAGFSESVKKGSSSPLVVRDIFDVACDYVKKTASVRAYSPVCRDMQMVLGQQDMKEILQKAMGRSGYRYLVNFLDRSYRDKAERTGNVMYSLFEVSGNMAKRAAVAWNFSTVAKQYVSILRAMPEIHYKYINAASSWTGISKKTGRDTEYSGLYDEMVKNSGVAQLKMLGYSDTGFRKSLRQIIDKNYVDSSGMIRSLMTSNRLGQGLLGGYDKFIDLGMSFAAKADEVTWVRIWKACKLETADKFPNLTEAEKLKKTVDRFEEIIGKTQVVDSLMDTAPFKETATGTGWGAFMNEPVKDVGQLMTVIGEVRDKKPGAGKHLAAVTGMLMLRNLFIVPAISAIFSGLRDEEDDSDQAFAKFLKNFCGVDLTDGQTDGIDIASSQMVTGLFDTLPIVGQVYELVTGAVQNYSNNRLETQNLVKLTDAVETLAKADEGTPKTPLKAVLDVISAAGVAVGLPTYRMFKDAGALVRFGMSATDNHMARWEYNKLFYNLRNSDARSGKYFYDIMAHAYKEGDTAAYQQMRDELSEIPLKSSFGVSQNTITNAIEDRGGKIEVGSALWYIDLQAAFCLDGFKQNHAVEQVITEVYKATNNSSVLPSPAGLTWNKTVDYGSMEDAEQAQKEVTLQIPGVEYETQVVEGKLKYSFRIADVFKQEAFVEEAGQFSYDILYSLLLNEKFRSLDDFRKSTVIRNAYSYAKERSRKNLYSDYEMGSNVRKKLYSENATPAEVGKVLVEDALD